jgi:hypothetical protein
LESWWKDLIEDFKQLYLNIGWMDCHEDLVQHVFHIEEVGLVEGIHHIDAHTVLDEGEVLLALKLPANKPTAEIHLLGVGEWIG